MQVIRFRPPRYACETNADLSYTFTDELITANIVKYALQKVVLPTTPPADAPFILPSLVTTAPKTLQDVLQVHRAKRAQRTFDDPQPEMPSLQPQEQLHRGTLPLI